LLLVDGATPAYVAAAGHVRGRMGDSLGAMRDLRMLDSVAPPGRPYRKLRAVVLAGIGQIESASAELEAIPRGERRSCPVCVAPFLRPLDGGLLAERLFAAQRSSIA